MSATALRIAAMILGCSAAATTALAQDAEPPRRDVLLIERIQAEPGMTLPTRGQRMSAVRAAFGEPAQALAAVGGSSAQRPPITRWVYPQFTVYFENDHVINAVLNKASPQELGPKPVD